MAVFDFDVPPRAPILKAHQVDYAYASEGQPETSIRTQRLQDHQQSQRLPENSIDGRRNQCEYHLSRSEEKSYSHLRALPYP